MSKVDRKNLYIQMNNLRREIENTSPVYLYQKDFDNGTYLMNQSGHYKLAENIVFSPNAKDDYFPRIDQSQYQTPGFTLGFFTAVAIYGENIYFDLNGYSISASKQFTMQQRFFSLIELANSPFIQGEGPATFSTQNSFQSAKNVIIRNGKLGLSSHHGIHGNMALNVLIEHLEIKDFEFIGIALNGDKNMFFHKINIGPNLKHSPLLATYSAARFARLFAKRLLNLPQKAENLVDNRLSAIQKAELGKRLDNLQREMDIAFNEVITTGQTRVQLFRNETGLPDGNCYGFLAKNKGFAVNEFVSPLDPNVIKGDNIFLRKVKVNEIKGRVDEIVGLSNKDGTGLQVDVAGAVLPILNIQDKEGKYKGNVLSDLQIYLSEIALNLGIQLGKNNISLDVINWSKDGSNIQNVLQLGYKYKCNTDSMGHENKGLIGFRFDALENLFISKCSYNDIANFGRLGNNKADGHYQKSNDASRRIGYTGTEAVGINISYCSNVVIDRVTGNELFAKNGDAIGINIMFGSQNVFLKEIRLDDIKAGKLVHGKWLGENYSGNLVGYTEELPNKIPTAIGISYNKGSVRELKEIHIHDLRSCGKPIKIRETP